MLQHLHVSDGIARRIIIKQYVVALQIVLAPLASELDILGRGTFTDSSLDAITITGNFAAIANSGLEQFYLETREFDDNLGHWRATYGAEATLTPAGQLELATVHLDGAPGDDVFFTLWDGIEEIGDFPAPAATAVLRRPQEG